MSTYTNQLVNPQPNETNLPEDSFILLDALEQDVDAIRDLKPTICVEIGSGSGVVSTFLAQLLHPTKTVILATDINKFACLASTRTALINNVEVEMVRCSLLSAVFQRLDRKVDVLMFNPPYVPTTLEEVKLTQHERDIGGAWAGGETGMDVTALVLESLDRLLVAGGRFYLVAVEQNKPKQIVQHLLDNNFTAEVTLRRRAGRELLYVIRAIKR